MTQKEQDLENALQRIRETEARIRMLCKKDNTDRLIVVLLITGIVVMVLALFILLTIWLKL